MSAQPGLKLAGTCIDLLGPPDQYLAPPGYDGLALAVMDAIWSIGVKYQGVEHVLERYRCWVSKEHGSSADLRTTRELLDEIRSVGGSTAFAKDVVHNFQRTSSRGGVLKADAVESACRALVDCDVLTAADLRERAGDPSIRDRWVAVHGQASGISWHYVLMNVRVDDLKADRMVCRFVAQSLNVPEVSPDTAYEEVVAAHKLLAEDHPGLSLRALDHAIWTYQSGRRR